MGPIKTSRTPHHPLNTGWGETFEFYGLLLLLSFGILTIWTRDRWATSALEVGVFTLAASAAFRAGFLAASWPVNWFQLPLGIAVLWGMAQLLAGRSVYRFETWVAVLGWLALFLANSVAFQLFDNPVLRGRFRTFAVSFAACIALWAILQLVSSDGKILWYFRTQESDNPTGPFLSYDLFAAFIELLLPIALWQALADRRRALFYGAAAALMYAAVIASASRAGSVLVNLELGVVLIPALTRAASRAGVRRIALRIGLFVLIATAVVGWNEVLKRFQAKDPLAGRREAWQTGLVMVREHPWFGFGLGTWTTVYPHYAFFDIGAFMNAAHSDWLQWAGDGGVPFAIVLLAVSLRALRLAATAPWAWGIVFVFLHSLVDFPLQKPAVFLWLVVLLAALEAGQRNRALSKDVPQPSGRAL